MVMSVKDTVAQRNDIGQLDTADSFEHWIYLFHRREFIGTNESRSVKGDAHVYDDKTGKSIGAEDVSKGNRTVAVGFNLLNDKDTIHIESARGEWNAAFADAAEKDKPSFDDVRSGKTAMTQGQIDKLFNYSASLREGQVESYLGKDTWKQLKPNEKLALLDLDYNSGTSNLGDKNSKKPLYTAIQDLAEKRTAKDYKPDPAELDNILWEIKNHSISETYIDKHKEVAYGLTQRRSVEATMFNSYDRDLSKLPVPEYYEGKDRDDAIKASDKIAGVIKDHDDKEAERSIAKHNHKPQHNQPGHDKHVENEGLVQKNEFAARIDSMIADWQNKGGKKDELQTYAANGADLPQGTDKALPPNLIENLAQKGIDGRA